MRLNSDNVKLSWFWQTTQKATPTHCVLGGRYNSQGGFVFTTIIAGVTVFVLGQFILKLILEPVIHLKGVFGKISSLLLREQSKFTNCVENEELYKEVRDVSSSLLSQCYSIPYFNFIHSFLSLPSKKDILEASRALNYIGYCVFPGAKESTDSLTPDEVHHQLKSISNLLNIPTSYSEL